MAIIVRMAIPVHRYDLISCHDCGVLHRRRPVRPREKARCVRCHAVLYRGIYSDASRMAAITLGAIFTFLIAQFFPIVELAVGGYTTSATLLGAIHVLWTEKMQLVAAVVFLFTIVLPAVELGSLLYVTLGAARRPSAARLRPAAARGAARRASWGMTEVLMIGILVTIVKMTSLAQVLVQPGLFAFGALTLLLAVVVSFDPVILWNMGEHLPGPERPGAASRSRYQALEKGAPLLACHSCGLVANAQPRLRRQHCARCGTPGCMCRRPDSIGRTWALLRGGAMILYIPANLLPVMYTQSLFGGTGGRHHHERRGLLFWTSGSPAWPIIIFVASIVVPVLKLAVAGAAGRSRRSGVRAGAPLQRTRSCTAWLSSSAAGRCSTSFVVTLTVALVRFQSLAVITAGPGALAFCAVVVLTMLASMQFDPRLIWDPVDGHAKKNPFTNNVIENSMSEKEDGHPPQVPDCRTWNRVAAGCRRWCG
jgi:paraquat-inducible protein A